MWHQIEAKIILQRHIPVAVELLDTTTIQYLLVDVDLLLVGLGELGDNPFPSYTRDQRRDQSL